MKKLLLLGVIGLGSMSFTNLSTVLEESGCWEMADNAMIDYFLHAESLVSQDELDLVWNATFAACANTGGQETVVITVTKG